MSRRLGDIIPEVDSLLALQPEELGAEVLQILRRESSRGFDRLSLFEELMEGLALDDQLGATVAEAVGEALNWLEAQGFLASRPIDHGREVLYVTRRGRELPERRDSGAYRNRNSTLLPFSLLHPIIAQRAYPAFLRGEYDTAVFTAFKAVEVGVRKAAGLPSEVIGTRLMREAFNPGGPLADVHIASAEQDAVSHLFAGAIGHAKNPHSHRDDPVQPEDAGHLLMFASYLLRIVDIRAADKALESR